jgi:hypothetical protein
MHGIYDFICDIEVYLFKYFHTNKIMLPYFLLKMSFKEKRFEKKEFHRKEF